MKIMTYLPTMTVVVIGVVSATYVTYKTTFRYMLRRWFVRKAMEQYGEMEEAMAQINEAFGSIAQLGQQLGMKSFPKIPEISNVFEEYYDAETGKWNDSTQWTLGFRTREEAEMAMASLIILDGKLMGKLEVVKK